MKVIIDGADSQPFDRVGDLRVLVVYQNAAFALHSKAMLERVGRAAGDGGRLILTLWDFDSLAVTPLMQIAAEDARNSDILVFAAQEGECLPQAIRDWIARWLLTKTDLPRAIVASLQSDPERNQRPPVLLPYLAQVAEYGKMHFFSGTSEGLASLDLDRVRVAHDAKTETASREARTQSAPATDTQVGIPHSAGKFEPLTHRKQRTTTSVPRQGVGKE